MLAIGGGELALCISLILAGSHKGNDALLMMGVLFGMAIGVELVVIVVILAVHPSRLWRTIVLTPLELRLPDPKWRSVPVDEVSGIGLGLSQKAPGSKSGTWAPMFWRTDGSRALVMGLGFVTSRHDPEGTRPSAVVKALYRRIIESQGPSGALATQAVQRHPQLSVWQSVVKVWDPSVHLEERAR